MSFRCVFVADEESCDNLGECYDAPVVDFSSVSSLEECRDECQQNPECQFFTWFGPNSGRAGCLLYSNCDGFNATVCTDCHTGSVDCSLYTCFKPGNCHNGSYVLHSTVIDADRCLEDCKNSPECTFFSFNPDENDFCLLTSSCPAIDTNCDNCVYGQVECQLDEIYPLNIMVATGFYSTGFTDHTEVVDANEMTGCPYVSEKYPLSVETAVGLRHNGKMVICGGAPATADCYSYANDQWSLEPFALDSPRNGMIAAEIRPEEWMVMGGNVGGSYYTPQTWILKNGIFRRGPDMPEFDYSGSCVMLNQTHLFVAMGATSPGNHNPRNYFFDINTEKWTQIAERTLKPDYHHSSGTFYNSTADEIQIANVGKFGIEVYSPSTDSWHSGIANKALNGTLNGSAAIQQDLNSFILIGGETLLGYSGDVYQFDENGLSLIKANVLNIPRAFHVAMAIDDSDFECN